MTDEQIFENEIKCIIRRNECVCNGGSDCTKCDLLMDSEEFVKCYNRAIKNIDLTNRQKAKIEELRSDKIIAERHEKDTRDLYVDCARQLEEAKAEIESLKRGVTFTFTIEDFESIKETVISSLDNKIKSEAIKDFAERLKRTSIGLEIGDDKKFKMTVVSTLAIDNLVKEMTEVQE